ncbi:hypothetical protein HFU84_04240 [Acidithiobacillus sp. CV18-2]|uniref:Uncharacterized protein n=1 Tax=Igneacidithiobacillus copahuensis TaxID=2724909 RepID=A0AAE3CKG0_9PROT|nr:hypothetical protein [Igneacidithiobacillus copahuensis]MBU2754771.1 hypothetical protein [Acidithiobacillus sp. CV18-3]MBU2758395.1 hypothetical protein [Acidithiobacillus sp. BN09-2]MBU2776725.1 hypothetical protein [Acidithiobacillus sp. CV18-2]MBU2795446.1 hypothetical protein [Acidithiobacillus sp. VAN18-2]MBU2799018.1 hypothetical protein [Acidithiobacillus sp. VAN18-4]UTV81570.1 hypothetical protein MQE22_02820 [Acidithiobacillus sp. YTS05]
MPSIEDRLRKRLIWMTSDEEMLDLARDSLPAEWSLTAALAVEDFDDWQEILLHRFLVLDLGDPAIDHAVIDEIRREHQLNIPIFCYGGSEEDRLAARSARADRFFNQDEILQKLPEFVRQFSW